MRSGNTSRRLNSMRLSARRRRERPRPPRTHSAGCSRVPACRSRWPSRPSPVPTAPSPSSVSTSIRERSPGATAATCRWTSPSWRPIRPAGRSRRRDKRRRSPALGWRLRAPADVKVPSDEINVQSQLELAPGDYGLRVAVSDAATGKVASVFSDVTVPKFDSAPLSLSGVTVDIASSPSIAPVRDDETSVSAGGAGPCRAADLSGHRAHRGHRARLDARADPRRQRRRGARSVAALHRADVHQPPRGLRHHAPCRSCRRESTC